MRPRLRVFTGEDEGDLDPVGEATVSLPLSEFTEILAHAIQTNRTWLRDFGDDEVKIPSDLYEVLAIYQTLRPSA